jgi:hypothetical protein
MAALPVKGTWGTPSLVSGICGDSAGVQITVTEAGKTGQVAVVVTRAVPERAREEACISPDRPCEQLPDGYVQWAEFAPRDNEPATVYANVRLATTSGFFFDVTCKSDAHDDAGQLISLPPMDHPACTAQEARALALELVKTNWLD